jgi:uroporphyrinogen decarboxylase
MDSRECTLALLTPGGKSEKIGLYENIWPDTIGRWEREGYPAGASADEYFGFDICRIGQTFDVYPLIGVRELVEYNDEWSIYRNGAGASYKYWNHKSGTPEHIDFRMVSQEIWRRDYRSHLLDLDPRRFQPDQTRERYNSLRKLGKWICYNSAFIWETMRQSMGDICMYESLALAPEWIHDFNETYTQFYIKHYTYMFENIGLPDGIWLSEDLGYKNGLFCSPGMLDELFKPYYKRLVDYFHSLGLTVILHSCGDITRAMPFVADIGFDALHPMERKAGCDPLAYADKYAGKLAFIGGLDVRFLESGDKGIIKKEIEDLINGMKARGARYFFSSDHSITTNISLDTYKYALEVYKENLFY